MLCIIFAVSMLILDPHSKRVGDKKPDVVTDCIALSANIPGAISVSYTHLTLPTKA